MSVIFVRRLDGKTFAHKRMAIARKFGNDIFVGNLFCYANRCFKACELT